MSGLRVPPDVLCDLTKKPPGERDKSIVGRKAMGCELNGGQTALFDFFLSENLGLMPKSIHHRISNHGIITGSIARPGETKGPNEKLQMNIPRYLFACSTACSDSED